MIGADPRVTQRVVELELRGCGDAFDQDRRSAAHHDTVGITAPEQRSAHGIGWRENGDDVRTDWLQPANHKTEGVRVCCRNEARPGTGCAAIIRELAHAPGTHAKRLRPQIDQRRIDPAAANPDSTSDFSLIGRSEAWIEFLGKRRGSSDDQGYNNDGTTAFEHWPPFQTTNAPFA